MLRSILIWLGVAKHDEFGRRVNWKSKPKSGVWWSFAPKTWLPLALDALEHAETPHVLVALDGVTIWEEDVSEDLHRLALWSAEQAVRLETTERPVPSYLDTAIAAKWRWLRKEIDVRQLMDGFRELAVFEQQMWPSNFCTGVNATLALHRCVLLSMVDSEIHQAAPQAAHHGALHAACLASCRALQCDLLISNHVEESKQDDVCVRGLDCPAADGDRAEGQRAFDSKLSEVKRLQDRQLTDVLLLRMIGEYDHVTTQEKHGPVPDTFEWRRLADEVEKYKPELAQIVRHLRCGE
jgi:hypothetical protein